MPLVLISRFGVLYADKVEERKYMVPRCLEEVTCRMALMYDWLDTMIASNTYESPNEGTL